MTVCSLIQLPMRPTAPSRGAKPKGQRQAMHREFSAILECAKAGLPRRRVTKRLEDDTRTDLARQICALSKTWLARVDSRPPAQWSRFPLTRADRSRRDFA